MMTLTPAYGRDYPSRAAALADWQAGKDFIIRDISSPYDGKPCSIRDMTEAVKIRYKRLTQVFIWSPAS